MSQYANYAEFISFGGVPEGRLLSANPPMLPSEVEAYISAASEIIDSYLAIRYAGSVPLQEWGDAIRDAAISIAAFKIMSRRIGFKSNGSDESFEKDFKATMDWLGHLSKGIVSLPGTVKVPIKTDYGVPDVISPQSRYDTHGHND